MSEKNNGWSAFPVTEQHGVNPCMGLSMRDYFAAKALVSIIAVDGSANMPHTADLDAEKAYMYADAMLRARE